tara:strand:- start:129 stop:362 length:234 start_codon:yes stop_codon:yes gene_type:complete
MVKLTIDDKEYETDDFTDEQIALVKEVEMAQAGLKQTATYVQTAYANALYDARLKFVVSALQESLEAGDTPEETEAQ